ncbi:hypothetical protein GALMADRAFT_54207 [Galerina marginata CBS 339.88]|uniref:Protein kinase domain-containing protein n=1 Tax=Galerina marginata (strain CBS 339.88) TaxID=685588 RepID=A0A067U2H4_GALM3|nr:hypothetical protein GALMADRAFT_54207 [Galerina marginata CBS 339.88]
MATLNLQWANNSYVLRSRLAPSQMPQTAEVGESITNCVYNAKMGDFGQTPTKKAVLKLAKGLDAVKLLEHEYSLYTCELFSLQGIAIPMCYGLYKGEIDGVTSGCLILEKCVPMVDLKLDDRQFMINLCKIHAAGVAHNGLHKQNHIVQQGLCPRIIDFSMAEVHRCPGCSPADRFGRVNKEVTPCPELATLERIYGMKSGDPAGS